MEIERKWMVTGWPAGLEQTSVYNMDQGYISVRPTVRIRREALQGGRTALVLCFKGAGGLSREEIETEINAELFAKLEHLIGKPLIHKERRGYRLPGGLTLEVNCVDPDLPTAFWYAEVEYETEAQALAWDPAACGLADYLHDECTGKPGSSMGEYWLKTRPTGGCARRISRCATTILRWTACWGTTFTARRRASSAPGASARPWPVSATDLG